MKNMCTYLVQKEDKLMKRDNLGKEWEETLRRKSEVGCRMASEEVTRAAAQRKQTERKPADILEDHEADQASVCAG